jgi:hypothetical protein
MHEHENCDHVFEFCQHCDVVYCEKCGGEWKKVDKVNWKPIFESIKPLVYDGSKPKWPTDAIPMLNSYPVISSGHTCSMPGS